METMLTAAHEGRARRVLVLDATTRVLWCRRLTTSLGTAVWAHSRTHTECFSLGLFRIRKETARRSSEVD